MDKTISATTAARSFSELRNKVRFRGERFTIARGGKVIACLTPATSPVHRSLRELPDRLRELPSLGTEAKPFARDVPRARRKAPGLPRKVPWA